jgi:hypothetical protein
VKRHAAAPTLEIASIVGQRGSRSIRRLVIQRLSVSDATTEKLGPLRNDWERILLLRQETPELWMMPAQCVTAAVTMCSNPTAESSDLFTKLVA